MERAAQRKSQINRGVQLFGQDTHRVARAMRGRARDEPGGSAPLPAVVRAAAVLRGEGDRDHGVLPAGFVLLDGV